MKRTTRIARYFLVPVLLLFSAGRVAHAQQAELRGVWMTPRSGTGIWSKAEIARAMDSVASANFNVVYFNAWSRGWPLWRSDVFRAETGFAADPAAGTRDVLLEAITEAHRRGLELEAWMEYGFVGWWDGNNLPGYPKGPLFAAHPDWLARKFNGSDAFPSGSSGTFYWMSHNHPAVQQFMARLHAEIAARYDVDGIELDRIRYPQLDCGYDSVSAARYRSATGSDPPSNAADPGWMRWRADRLNEFHRTAYDSIKAANRFAIVSNAPSHYSSGTNYPAYETFLQDWRAWLNGRYLDAAQIQMYVRPATLATYIPSALSGVVDSLRPKAYAGVAPRTENFTLDLAGMIELISVTRNSGMRGNSVWYYNDIRDLGFLGGIRALAYPTRVPPPYRSEGWRDEGRILDEAQAPPTGGWTSYTLPPQSPIIAWGRSFAVAGPDSGKRVDYRLSVPASGWYSVFAHQVGGLINLTARAPFDLIDSAGTVRRVLVDQSAAVNHGWVKLGDAYLARGDSQLVVRLTDEGIGAGRYVAADAVMLQLNRKLSPGVVVTSVAEGIPPGLPVRAALLVNYPNPFNAGTVISWELPAPSRATLEVFDTLGRRVAAVAEGDFPAGRHQAYFDGSRLASGLYFARLLLSPHGARAAEPAGVRALLLIR
jgi:uncharacterized lipoprotein YddW (UPF0748 family)